MRLTVRRTDTGEVLVDRECRPSSGGVLRAALQRGGPPPHLQPEAFPDLDRGWAILLSAMLNQLGRLAWQCHFGHGAEDELTLDLLDFIVWVQKLAEEGDPQAGQRAWNSLVDLYGFVTGPMRCLRELIARPERQPKETAARAAERAWGVAAEALCHPSRELKLVLAEVGESARGAGLRRLFEWATNWERLQREYPSQSEDWARRESARDGAGGLEVLVDGKRLTVDILSGPAEIVGEAVASVLDGAGADSRLTDVERSRLGRLMRGKSQREIAEEDGVSEAAVSKSVHSAAEKLSDRAQVADLLAAATERQARGKRRTSLS